MVTGSHDDRGQLILIGSLLIAATIVGSIVLLNAIHESPDVYAQQDSRALEESELRVAELHRDLERSFLVNTSVDEAGEPLPYAREGRFENLIEDYESQYTNLSTLGTSDLVAVEMVDNETGGVARQNETRTGFPRFNGTDDPRTIIQEADKLPRFVVVVDETDLSSDDLTLRIEETGGADETTIQVTSSEVAVDPAVGPARSCTIAAEPVEIDLVNGTGAVSTNETYCEVRGIWSSLGPEVNVVVENGTDARGAYTVTGVDPSGSEIAGNPGTDNPWFDTGIGGDDYIVNPVYRIEYRTPNIEYNATFALYNGTSQ